ncbi:MAG: SHOCT domain-containing protein [Leptospiraceae bacterium]|nr:SHOCT domain-containing protein [Leptospiraceae bacterium]NUM41342.1 SHOCT domain-containing protein [Leptospiraceae bacterium]
MNMPKKELIDKLFNIICTRWMQFQNIPSDSTDNIASQIEKLASLKERGILTEEEFTQKKKQLLGI